MTEWSVLTFAGIAVAISAPLFYYRRPWIGTVFALSMFALMLSASQMLAGYPVRREPVDGAQVFGAQEDVVMAKEPGDSPRLFRAPKVAKAVEERAAQGQAGPYSVTRGQDGEPDLMPFEPEGMRK